MKLKICVEDDGFKDDGSRDSDEVFRTLFRKFPESVWERANEGYEVLI